MSTQAHFCPHCGKGFSLVVSAFREAELIFDPADPVQVEGFIAARDNQKGPLPSPHASGTDEFYRFNRGLHHFWNGGRLP